MILFERTTLCGLLLHHSWGFCDQHPVLGGCARRLHTRMGVSVRHAFYRRASAGSGGRRLRACSRVRVLATTLARVSSPQSATSPQSVTSQQSVTQMQIAEGRKGEVAAEA